MSDLVFFSHLFELQLEAALGVGELLDASEEGGVDEVVLEVHLLRRRAQEAVLLVAQLFRRLAFRLRVVDVRLRERLPGVVARVAASHSPERERYEQKANS